MVCVSRFGGRCDRDVKSICRPAPGAKNLLTLTLKGIGTAQDLLDSPKLKASPTGIQKCHLRPMTRRSYSTTAR